ncbi:MAG: aldehyde dehydrogenase family protein, partial [Halanaeroarchaeum sp.]
MPHDRDAYDLFIDGAFVASNGSERIDVEYPYDGTVWASVPAGTTADVDRAVAAARRAFESGEWPELLPSERASILHDIADVLDEHAQELGELETKQNGKLIREMASQMDGLGEWYRYYASQCRTDEGRTVPVESKGGDMKTRIRKEPRGVVAGITPWNSPLLLTSFKLAPALAAGCTFVHKPSSETPISALRFAELLTE